jgi:malic enzyme
MLLFLQKPIRFLKYGLGRPRKAAQELWLLDVLIFLIRSTIPSDALDIRATKITDEMCIEAAKELAKVAEDKGINEDYIIPNMDQWEVFPREAVAVGSKGIEQGVARVKSSAKERFKRAEEIIKKAREEVQLMMKEGFITNPDEE